MLPLANGRHPFLLSRYRSSPRLAQPPSSHPLHREDLPSLSWVRKLLDAFLISQEEFRSKGILSRAPLDHLISDFFERGVKVLDICNAIRDGIDQIHQWKKHLEIILVALHPSHRTLGEGQLRRARKALTHVTIIMLDHLRLHRRHSSPVLHPPIPARLHATAPIPISSLARNCRSLPCLAPRINLPRLLQHQDSTRKPISGLPSLLHGIQSKLHPSPSLCFDRS